MEMRGLLASGNHYLVHPATAMKKRGGAVNGHSWVRVRLQGASKFLKHLWQSFLCARAALGVVGPGAAAGNSRVRIRFGDRPQCCGRRCR